MTTAIAPRINNEQDEQNAENIDRMLAAVDNVRRNVADAIIPTQAITVVARPGEAKVTDRMTLSCYTGGSHVGVRVLDGAHEQIATLLRIPREHYNRLLADHPDLLGTVVEGLFHREPQKRMLRMLMPSISAEMANECARLDTPYMARAVVSDKFRPLDNAGVVDHILPAARRHNLRLAEWDIDDKRFNVRFVGPERTIGEVRRAHGFKENDTNFHVKDANGKDRAWVNEVLSFGVAVTNSETGHGALAVREMSRILRCLNNYIKNDTTRTRHVGGKKEETDGIIIGADTRRLELAAIYARVRDTFIAAVGDGKQKQIANMFADAMASGDVVPADVPVMEFVDIIGKRFEFSDDEREILQREVTDEMIVTGQRAPNRFTIAQGVTAMAKLLPDGGFKRKQEIETIGWRILEDTTSLLVKAADRATRK